MRACSGSRLDEEGTTDKQLTKLAEEVINLEACAEN